MAESWVRLWAGMTTDPKWQTIARKSGQPRCLVIALFTHLMLEANEADERGSVADVCVEDVASALDCDEEQIEAILSAMQERVIKGSRLSGWEERQPQREDSGREETGALSNTERSRIWREKKRAEAAEQRDATQRNEVQRDATQRNAPEAEAEAEAEAEVNPTPPLSSGVHGWKGVESEAAESPPLDGPDPITHRAIELSSLLHQRGAALQASDPRVRAWAERGISDAQALTALETAETRRTEKGSSQAINAGLLDAILSDVAVNPARQGRPPPASRSPTLSDQRRAASMTRLSDVLNEDGTPKTQQQKGFYDERTIDSSNTPRLVG